MCRVLVVPLLVLAAHAEDAPPWVDPDLNGDLTELASAHAKARRILIDDKRYPILAKAYAGCGQTAA